MFALMALACSSTRSGGGAGGAVDREAVRVTSTLVIGNPRRRGARLSATPGGLVGFGRGAARLRAAERYAASRRRAGRWGASAERQRALQKRPLGGGAGLDDGRPTSSHGGGGVKGGGLGSGCASGERNRNQKRAEAPRFTQRFEVGRGGGMSRRSGLTSWCDIFGGGARRRGRRRKVEQVARGG